MADAAKTIEAKAKAMAKALTDAAKKARDKKIEALKKKAESAKGKDAKGKDAKGKDAKGKDAKAKPGAKAAEDFDKKVWKVRFQMSKADNTSKRTPEAQAETCARGVSWSCASAHMVDKARHVAMYMTAPGGKEKLCVKKPETPYGSKDENFWTYAEFGTAWSTAMKAQDLRNYVGGRVYHSGDAFHVELPSGRLLHSDKAVQTCMKHYAELTRLDPKYAPNKKFEDNKAWKSDLAPHIAAAEKKAKDLADKAKREEMAKLRFDGKASKTWKLAKGLSKNGAFSQGGLAPILPPKETVAEAGKTKIKKATGGGAAVWDSLARGIFEKIGLLPTSGFDIKVTCGVTYDVVSYDYLTQSFLQNLQVNVMVVWNTPAASVMGMDIAVQANLALAKNGTEPTGTVVFTIDLDTPLQNEKAVVTLTLTGAKVAAKVKM